MVTCNRMIDVNRCERTELRNYLEGKAVVVTGAGRGIGRAVAIAAAAEGASVVVADYGGTVDGRNTGLSDPATEVVAEIVAAGGHAIAVAADVSTMAGGRSVVAAAVDSFGRLDGLVCCAGITVMKYMWELEEREWDDVIAVHLKGHFSCAQAAAKVMMPQQSGRLVFIGSGAFAGAPNLPSYATAKAGILGFTWSTANALRWHGITTNCVVPSAATRMSDTIFGEAQLLREEPGPLIRSELASGTDRDPANIAPTVLYLLGDESRGVNGQVYRVQGYEIARLAEFGWDKEITNDGPWDIATIAKRLPRELGPKTTPTPVPWPERPGR
ncbi:NAD(P)-dependent dehydrogenase (short-subunit alcohol dehydrogenase family) [Mycobacterium sp. BK086]|nr:NAD(P)-dependent dehydrogenase (short-subunit alcohol dehydrogenase family) [Mycobacterium sp. BK086]